MMKAMIILMFLFSSSAYGQRHTDFIDEALRKGDSLEVLYTNDNHFKCKSDTLPSYYFEESRAYERSKLVQYFYDSSNVLKKVSFRNGEEGHYTFFFEGAYLRKVRVLRNAGMINLQYFFTNKDNQYTPSEIGELLTAHSEQKDAYELLKMGKSFLTSFKTLL